MDNVDTFFKLSTHIYGQYSILQFSHIKYNTHFSIIPELGGAINNFSVNGEQILVGANNLYEIQNQTIKAFAGAQLFPFPNRIKNGKFKIGIKDFQLPVNEPLLNNSLHGLIYNKAFNVVLVDENKGVIKLRYEYKKENNGYPFHVQIENSYQLTKNALIIKTSLLNKGNASIPVGHGWHPYFKSTQNIGKSKLQIYSNEYFELDRQFIPTGKKIKDNTFLKVHQIGTTKFDQCYEIEPSKDLIAKLINPQKKLTISLLAKGYPYLQIYIPPNRDCIALEPQTALPDTFNNKIGCIELSPVEPHHFIFEIRVD